jgi:hypothetical protein
MTLTGSWRAKKAIKSRLRTTSYLCLLYTEDECTLAGTFSTSQDFFDQLGVNENEAGGGGFPYIAAQRRFEPRLHKDGEHAGFCVKLMK